MNGTVRLGLFAAVLAVTAVAAAAIGVAVGPLDRGRGQDPSPALAREEEGTHGAEEPGVPAPQAGGVAISQGALRVEPRETALRPGVSQPLGFTVLAGERPLRDYDVEHEREMHLIVVPRDLSGFQHEHPALDRSGMWHATIRPSAAGPYRAFADFTTGGERTVLGWDLLVPGAYRPAQLPDPRPEVRAGPYTVTLGTGVPTSGSEATLEFRVTRGAASVTVDPYLGARGHLVILREGDLAYLHTHADEDALRFGAEFPSPGRYRAFLQFSHGGSVRTAAFTVEVPE